MNNYRDKKELLKELAIRHTQDQENLYSEEIDECIQNTVLFKFQREEVKEKHPKTDIVMMQGTSSQAIKKYASKKRLKGCSFKLCLLS